jgi:hypothetical protein
VSQAIRHGAGVEALSKHVQENRLWEIELGVTGKVPLLEVGSGPEDGHVWVDVAALDDS